MKLTVAILLSFWTSATATPDCPAVLPRTIFSGEVCTSDIDCSQMCAECPTGNQACPDCVTGCVGTCFPDCAFLIESGPELEECLRSCINPCAQANCNADLVNCCKDSTFDSDATALCAAADACPGVELTSQSRAECSASDSCSDITSTASDVVCRGPDSCEDITSDDSDLLCVGPGSCERASVSNTQTAGVSACTGPQSCLGIMSLDSVVGCIGVGSCQSEPGNPSKFEGSQVDCDGNDRTCSGAIFSGGSTGTCTGVLSCKEAGFSGGSSGICAGELTCDEAGFSGSTGTCTGEFSCLEAGFSGGSTGTCTGENSCQEAGFSGGSTGTCTGENSCDFAVFSGSTGTCGESSCGDAVIESGSLIVCEGHLACIGIKVSRDSAIVLEGTRKLQDVTGVSRTTAACTGDSSCAFAVFSGSSGICAGELTCQKAVIESGSLIVCIGLRSCLGITVSRDSAAIVPEGTRKLQGVTGDSPTTIECTGDGSCEDADFGPGTAALCTGPNSCVGAQFAQAADGLEAACCSGDGCVSSGVLVCATVGVNSDPVVTGLKGQSFLFKGLNAKWFAALAEDHLQWNWLLHVFEECEDGLMPTYVTKHAFTFADYEIEVGVKDVGNYNPGCPAGEGGVCLGEGSLEMSINGETITTPGEYMFENGDSVTAFNIVGTCQTKRDVHMMHRLKEEEEELRATVQPRARRLSEEEFAITADLRVLDVLEARLHRMEDREACSAWIAEKRIYRDLFDSPGSWASVYITTATYAFQIDYRQEVERCHAHVVDAVMMLSPNDEGVEEWSGVLGETQTLKFDPATGQALKGRDAILKSVHDEDYIVDGPWGTAFPARRS